MRQPFIDRYTKTDELLRELLLEIRSPKGTGGGIGVSRLVQLEEEKAERDLNIVFWTYPATGETVTLSAGITILNFEDGTITDTSGTTTNMYHSLRSEHKDFLRSLYVNSDKAIKVQMDTYDEIFVDEAKDFQGTYFQFKKVIITTTEDTEIFVLACTNPEAILTLVDKASEVSGGARLIYGDKVDEAGANVLKYFDTDQVPGTATATKYIQLTPALTHKFRLTSIRYYIHQATPGTYRLYLLEQATAHTSPIQQQADIVYDSKAGMAHDTEYIELTPGVLPIDINLDDVGKLYYMIDHSGTPGYCKGYLIIRGVKLT